MKRIALSILLALGTTAQAAPWTYRGTLNDGGAPANGRYDIRLSLLDAGGAKSLAYPLTFTGVEVKNGSFAIDVDFGMDLTQFGALKLKTEVAQGDSGFVALGEPKDFDAKAALGSVCWDTAGNAGTNPVTDFLGTTDNQKLMFRVNNNVGLEMRPESKGQPLIASPGVVTTGIATASIALGNTQTIGGEFSAITGGIGNVVNADFAHIGGGKDNVADGNYSVVSGGFYSSAIGVFSGVLTGDQNIASGGWSSVLGGQDNRATGPYSAVSGGKAGLASGYAASVVAGGSSCAGGDYSLAAGSNAKVRSGNGAGDVACTTGDTAYSSGDANGDEGAFIWADTQISDFVSSGPNQFLVRADGGVGINGTPPNANGGFEFSIYGNTPDSGFVEFSLVPKLSLNGNTGERIELGVGPGGAGNNDASFRIAHRNNAGNYFERVLLNPTGSVEIRSSTSNATQGVTMAAGAGSWSSLSDRNVKTGIAPSDTRAVLDKLVAMPVSEWSYKAQGEGVRHIGPMAQDFAAAFGVGENDTTISTVDADGVALAAIQGLNAKLEAELAQSRSQNAQLQTQLEQLAMRLAALEAAKEQ